MDNIPSNPLSPGLPVGRSPDPTSSNAEGTAPSGSLHSLIKEDLLKQLEVIVHTNPVPGIMTFQQVYKGLSRSGFLDEESAEAIGQHCLDLFNHGHKRQALFIFGWISPQSHPEAYKKFTFSPEAQAFAIARREKSKQYSQTPDRLGANFFLERIHLPGNLDKELAAGYVSGSAPYLAQTISVLAETGGLEKLNDSMNPKSVEQMKGFLKTFCEQLLEVGEFASFFELHELHVLEKQHLSARLSQRVRELQTGQSILVPMSTRQHVLIFEVEQQDDGKLTVRIYNTGGGVDMHAHDPQSTKRYLTHLTFENIEPEQLQNPRSWAEFVNMKHRIELEVEEWSRTMVPPPSHNEVILEHVKRHYAEVIKICGNPQPSRNVLLNPYAFQRIQVKGSCAYLVHFAVLRRKVMDHPAFIGNPEEAYAAYKLIKGIVTHEFAKKEAGALRPEVKEALLDKLRMHDKELALANALADPKSCEREIELFNQQIERVNQHRRAAGEPTLDEENPPLTKIEPKPPGYSPLRYFGLIRGHIRRAVEKELFNQWSSPDSAIKDLVFQRVYRTGSKIFPSPLPETH